MKVATSPRNSAIILIGEAVIFWSALLNLGGLALRVRAGPQTDLTARKLDAGLLPSTPFPSDVLQNGRLVVRPVTSGLSRVLLRVARRCSQSHKTLPSASLPPCGWGFQFRASSAFFSRRDRPVSQWVGDAPGATAQTTGLGRNSSSSTSSSSAAAAAAAAAAGNSTEAAPGATNPEAAGEAEPTATTASEPRTPLGAAPQERVAGSSSLSTEAGEPAAGVPGGAETATVAEGTAADSEVKAGEKDNALGWGETGGRDGAGGAEGRTVGVVEDAAVGDAAERTEAAGAEIHHHPNAAEKQVAGTTATTLPKTPSMLEMLKMKRGIGIFGKSNAVVPSPIETAASAGAPNAANGTASSSSSSSSAAAASLPPAGTTEAEPEPSTQELLRVETDEDAADATAHAGGPEGAEGDASCANGAGKAAAATTPSMLNGLPSRFKMSMGMFGAGKASPAGGSRGSTSAPSPAAAAAASAPATAAGTASTPSAAAGASSTPSGGSGKFSSYARRAGNFLGED